MKIQDLCDRFEAEQTSLKITLKPALKCALIAYVLIMALYTYLMIGVGFAWGSAVQEQELLNQLAIRELNVSNICYQPQNERYFLKDYDTTRLGYHNESAYAPQP